MIKWLEVREETKLTSIWQENGQEMAAAFVGRGGGVIWLASKLLLAYNWFLGMYIFYLTFMTLH